MLDWTPYQFATLGASVAEVPVSILERGTWIPTIANDGIMSDQEVYFAFGQFPQWHRTFRRRAEDLSDVPALVLDVDFCDYINLGRDVLQTWPDEELWALALELDGELRKGLAAIDVEPYLTVYSGYGLYLYIAVDPRMQASVFRNQQHAFLVQIVEHLQHDFGEKIILPNTLDPGTRLSRVIGSVNLKNPHAPRRVRVVRQLPQVVFHDALPDEEPLARFAEVGVGAAGFTDTQFDQLVDFLSDRWAPGTRHALSLGVSALCAKAGIAPDQCLMVIQRVAQRMGDGEVTDRAKAVATTYERVSSGRPVSGYYSLVGVLSGPDRQVLDFLIGNPYRPKVNVTVEFAGDGGPEDPAAPAQPVVERVAFDGAPEEYLAGWVKEYVDTMRPTTEAPMAFHLGVAVTLVGSVIGRSQWVMYGSERLYPNLYTMLVGVSGKTRKDSAIRRGTSILRYRVVGLDRSFTSGVSIQTDVGSSEGLLAFLQEHPSTLLHISELSRLMSNAKREVTRTISPLLMELWDNPPEISNQTKNNPIRVSEPFVSALAAVQPDILADQMGDSEIHSGFANRWFYVCGNGGAPIPWPLAVTERRQELLLQELVELKARHSGGWNLSPEAFEAWQTWYLEHFESSGTSEELAMQQRLPTMAIKLALIRAAARFAERIEYDDLHWATRLIDWSWANIRQLIGEWGGNIDHRLVARIEAAIRAQGGACSVPKLERLTRSRKWGVREFNQVMAAMEKSGLIEHRPEGVILGPR